MSPPSSTTTSATSSSSAHRRRKKTKAETTLLTTQELLDAWNDLPAEHTHPRLLATPTLTSAIEKIIAALDDTRFTARDKPNAVNALLNLLLDSLYPAWGFNLFCTSYHFAEDDTRDTPRHLSDHYINSAIEIHHSTTAPSPRIHS